MIVNGNERQDKIVVTRQDSVTLIPQNERLEGSWQLVIAPDRMAAAVLRAGPVFRQD
ncbi:hypothetical protein [Moorella sulfitireducens (nom. illeg.)]|uniref:hypothetical protein n=1 Tax=Neomoorella sulfitireducens TaxID=2972948 RepID=UPI0021AD2383|nr:hypothetical protein [Moorella sulfitireducens]